MRHQAYLGQMLEKGGGFAVGIFPEGLALCGDCPNLTEIALYLIPSLASLETFWWITHISLSHTVHNREICGTCRRYVGDGTQDGFINL